MQPVSLNLTRGEVAWADKHVPREHLVTLLARMGGALVLPGFLMMSSGWSMKGGTPKTRRKDLGRAEGTVILVLLWRAHEPLVF